jgi:hypothetical protein
MAGNNKPMANSAPRLTSPNGGDSAARGPAVATVRVEVPTPFTTDIAASEHVTGGLTAGDTVQASDTVEGLNPPDALTVTVDFADPPGTMGDGDNAVVEMLKAGETTGKTTAVEELTLKLASPLYAAVMLCVPALSVAVEKIATPLPFSGDAPSCVVPSIKFIEPVGIPELCGATIAVNVTAWFRFAAVGVAPNAVLVFAFCTT